MRSAVESGRCRFAAWGTYVVLETRGSIAAAEQITRELLEVVGRACSRFREDSDLVAVNRAAGSWVPCSPVLVAAVDVALQAASDTDGLLDPLLGRPLAELGYDRDFRELVARATVPTSSARPGAWRAVRTDPVDPAVRIPAGTSLDLGATAKAWASDLIATTLSDALEAPVLVSLGGDVRVTGPEEADRPWWIQVAETPAEAITAGRGVVVGIHGGGLATSSTVVRRWRSGGAEQHHLLDPRTGRPAQGPWRTISATGPTCVAANVATTAALVLQHDAVAWLDRRSVDARLIAHDGTTLTTGRWPADLTEEVSCSTC